MSNEYKYNDSQQLAATHPTYTHGYAVTGCSHCSSCSTQLTGIQSFAPLPTPTLTEATARILRDLLPSCLHSFFNCHTSARCLQWHLSPWLMLHHFPPFCSCCCVTCKSHLRDWERRELPVKTRFPRTFCYAVNGALNRGRPQHRQKCSTGSPCPSCAHTLRRPSLPTTKVGPASAPVSAAGLAALLQTCVCQQR